MLKGLPYLAWKDGLEQERLECRKKLWRFNTQIDWSDEKALNEELSNIIGKIGEKSCIVPPFMCDYGSNIEIGKNFYANYDCKIVDVARVRIGDNVLLGPNVTICTAGHPIHPEARNSRYEYGREITIGSNTWIGMGVLINPGVKIGKNVVIGSGAVVTKDIPDNSVAVGNPCKVIKTITDEDKKYYFKNLRFDIQY